MRILFSAVLVTTLCGSGAVCVAQATASPTAATAPVTGTVPAAKLPSAVMKPAVDTLQATVNGLRVEKWKTSNAVREEMDANVASIRRDLEDTLPPLLAAADAAPDSVTRLLPVFRNIGALYDVLLRIDAVGRLVAPSQQSAALDQATASLDDARRSLGDHMQSVALAQEKQVVDLKAALRAVPPPPPVAPVVNTPPPTAAKKRPTRPKTVKKTTPPATPASGAAAPAPAPKTTPAPAQK